MTRLTHAGTLRLLAGLYVACLAATYLTYVAPGKSYVAVWLGDVMGFIDIAHSVHLGQMPYRDFSFSYGPLVALIPGWGFDLGLNAGAMFGFQGLVVAALLLMACLLALPSRLSGAAAGLVFVLVWLLCVVPLGESERYTAASWGTFYNRQGWAALTVILLFYVEPAGAGQRNKWRDAVALAALLLFEVYNKFTFGLVGLGFVAANAMVSSYNRQVSLRALLLVACVAGLLEALFHFHAGYLHGIVEQVGMVQDGGPDKWLFISILVSNSAMIAASLGAVLAAASTGRRSTFDWLYAAGVIAANVLLRTTIGANAVEGVMALVAVFVSMGELARRAEADAGTAVAPSTRPRWEGHIASLGCLFLAGAFVAVDIGNRLLTWQDFIVKIRGPSPSPLTPARLASLRVSDSSKKKGGDLSSNDYMSTIVEGTNLLLAQHLQGHSVLTFDMVNLFPYAADMQPPAHSRPLFWVNGPMTSDPRRLPSPEALLGRVDHVMVPRKPYKAEQLANMQRIYGPYLQQHFDVSAESPNWQLWTRRQADAPPGR